jgi:hypothetical protein
MQFTPMDWVVEILNDNSVGRLSNWGYTSDRRDALLCVSYPFNRMHGKGRSKAMPGGFIFEIVKLLLNLIGYDMFGSFG